MKWHWVAFAMFHRWAASQVTSSTHTQGEGTTQGHGHQVMGIIGSHLKVCPHMEECFCEKMLGFLEEGGEGHVHTEFLPFCRPLWLMLKIIIFPLVLFLKMTWFSFLPLEILSNETFSLDEKVSRNRLLLVLVLAGADSALWAADKGKALQMLWRPLFGIPPPQRSQVWARRDNGLKQDARTV